MFNFIAQNKYGQQLELTNNAAYTISEIDGLDPPDSTINTTKNAGTDGSVYNSSYVNDRVITITLSINSPAERNRINLYKYFKAKFPVRLYYQNNTRNVYIDGYVQSIQIGYFEKKQTAQIVVNCPKPYFNDINSIATNFHTTLPLFEFPFSIPKSGVEFSIFSSYVEKNIISISDIDIGMIITITAVGSVENPTIYNSETNDFIKLNFTMQDGDEITIDTIMGEKSVTLLREGVTTNLIGSLVNGSTWLQLEPSDNLFLVTADANSDHMNVYFTVTNQYEGV